jgi:hypothetical protein
LIEVEKTELVTIKYAQGLASKVFGGIVGGGAGLLTANPVLGAVIGATVAHTLETIGREVIDRNLTGRQELRVGRAVAIAFGKIAEFEQAGRSMRRDGFFEPVSDGRAAGEEVTEAALYTAMNSAEEKKIDFIATLLANIATTDSIDEPTAHLLIEHAQRLSFRSYILLKIISKIDSNSFNHSKSLIPAGGLSVELQGIVLEIFNLEQNGLVVQRAFQHGNDRVAISLPDGIEPSWLGLSEIGLLLYRNLGLTDIPEQNSFQLALSQLQEIAAARPSVRVILNGGGPSDRR